MNPLIQLKNATIPPVLIALTLGCFALSPQARAQCREGCDLLLLNTFLGDKALVNNTFGTSNTATGASALQQNTVGADNTATGSFALHRNTAGSDNTANGFEALFVNTGSFNTATGSEALVSNTTGGLNTATGYSALAVNTTGSNNTANGFETLVNNTTGNSNTAAGFNVLHNNVTGNDNTAEGYQALLNTTGSSNIAVGSSAGTNLTTGSNNIDIGNDGVAGESNTIRIGTNGTQTATFLAGIRGVPITGGQAVGINGSGQLGIKPSSVRYKETVQPMDTASEVILALRPVTFRYKKELDPKGAPQFGLVAEEVAKVNPDLVVLDDQGKPFTVRYEEVNAMLLNEFLKEHHKVETLEATVSNLITTVKVQAEQIQKVSAQLELTKAAPQTVVNNQ
jgi:hypothetical protein